MSQYSSLCWSDSASLRTSGANVFSSHTDARLNWNDAATLVVDSLVEHPPVHVHTSTKLKHADAVLNGAGQRYALVLDAHDALVGIVTARELHGRKAIQRAQALSVAHDELSVDYLMQPIERVPVLHKQQLSRARIGDLVSTLQSSGSDFLLLEEQGRWIGIVAALTIVAKTGESVQIRHHTNSFADLIYAFKHADDIEL